MNKMFKISKSISTLFVIRRNIISSLYPKLEIEKQNFTNFILNKIKRHPKLIAMIDGLTGTKYSYEDLEQRIHSVASALTTRGLKKGDNVGILACNSVDYLSVYMATIGCGATVVAFNPSYTKYELDPLMEMTRPKFLFANSKPLKAILSSSDINFVEKIFNMDSDSILGTSSMKSLLQEGSSHSPINDESYKNPDDISLIIFSSGTTGYPKGVPITNTNLIAASNFLEFAHASSMNSVLISVLPMFHIYGVLVSFILTIVSRSACVILPSFNPTTFLESIEKYQITHLHLVPPMILFLLNNPDVQKYDISSVLKITSGGAPVDKEIEVRISNLFLSKNSKFAFGQGYGLSESTGAIALRPHIQEISNKKLGSVGLLLQNQEMKILSIDTGEEVGPNVAGEIVVRGPNIIKHYYKMTEAMNASYFSNGWLRTGDMGYYDDDQYIYLCDRIKELIKVKGHQVAPAELEGLLLTHPGVLDCAVIGVVHDKDGEVPRAFVVKNGEVTETEIQDFVEKNLSSYKHLKGGVHFVDSIPKSPSGKLLRRLLKETE